MVVQVILGPSHRKAFATLRGRTAAVLTDPPEEFDEKAEQSRFAMQARPVPLEEAMKSQEESEKSGIGKHARGETGKRIRVPNDFGGSGRHEGCGELDASEATPTAAIMVGMNLSRHHQDQSAGSC
jgi:hypothetical protein